jgi:DNA mismatch repair protein MutL
MSKIKILDEQLVNKIAAGEVIERPASVVKELLDNAYDSGASMIIVEVVEGGTKKILISDNGSGMDKSDVELAFKAHATSKISSVDDLLNIKSYGFRGEALSSIGAVSKVTLRSRLQNEPLGTELKIEGGNVISLGEYGGQMGTSVLVEDLFFNVPARREFLKAVQSEYRVILDIVNAHAIANPKVGLTFLHNEKVIYSFPKDDKLEDRVRQIMGNDFYEKIAAVFFEHPHLELYGFVGKPELASERKKNQFLFVNKRNVTSNSLSYAVKDAFGDLIPSNTHPPFILFLDVPGNIVDVNVHPRKEEVKFSDEQFIFVSIKSAVKKALERTNLTPGTEKKDPFSANPFTSGGLNNPLTKSPFSTAPKPGYASTGAPYKSPFSSGPGNPFSKDLGGSPRPFSSPFSSTGPQINKTPSTNPFPTPNALSDNNKAPFNNKPSYTDSFWDDPFVDDTDDPVKDTTENNKFIVVHNLYILVEVETGILIYDQHALHERILFEELTERYNKNHPEEGLQPLLTPVVLNLSVNEMAIISEFKTEMEKTGLILEEFGGNSFKISQVPSFMVNKDIKAIIHEFIEDLENNEKIKEIDTKSEKMLKYLACRTAYKAGDTIHNEEILAMINKLSTLNNEYTCPHGRPLKIEITLKELSSMFKRT